MRLLERSGNTGTVYAAITAFKHFFKDRLISIHNIIKGTTNSINLNMI